MRMHNQMVVAIAAVLVTVAVVATGYASTQTAMNRHDELASRPPLQNLTITTTTTDTTEGTSTTAPPPRPEQATAGTDRPLPVDPADPTDATSQDVTDCDIALLDDADGSNHGRLVSACIAQLREAGDFDGPPGAVIRDIARPDIENDGPPRSEQAEENNSSDDKSEDRATPPGQAKDKPNKDKD